MLPQLKGSTARDGSASQYDWEAITKWEVWFLFDAVEETDGAALETLVFQELRAINANHGLGYDLHFWRTRDNHEVDFVLYGNRGLHAFEVKRSARVRNEDLGGLKLFKKDYPMAKAVLLYGGKEELEIDGISVLPFASALPNLATLLGAEVDPKIRTSD